MAFLKKTFPDLPAVKNDRIAEVPVVLTESGPRVMEGLEIVAAAFYPEAQFN